MVTSAFSYRNFLQFLLSAVAVLLITCNLSAQNPPWVPVGPYGGDVFSIVSIGNTLFAAHSANGVFKSTDNGESWSQIPYRFHSGLSLMTHGSLLFARGNLLYRSTDMGETWEQMESESNWFDKTICFVGDTLYCANYRSEIYSSSDSGRTWKFMSRAPGERSSILASHERTLYFSADSGFYRSADGARTWERVMVTPTGRRVRAFAAHDSVMVLTIGDNPSVISDRLYRSTDYGVTWTASGEGATTDRINSIIWDGRRFLATGGLYGGLFISEDGATWRKCNVGLYDEVHTVCVAGSTLLAGSTRSGNSNNGIYRSTDDGFTWTLSNNGFSSINVKKITEHRGTLYGITGGLLYKSSDNGASWRRMPDSVPYRSVAVMETSDNALLMGTGGAGVAGADIYRSVDDGISWNRVDSGFTYVDRLKASGRLVVALVMRSPPSIGTISEVYRSTDGGAVWVRAGDLPADVSSLKSNPIDLEISGGHLFVTTSKSGILRSRDTGATWESVNNGLTEPLITRLASVHDVLIAGTGTGSQNTKSAQLFRSTDNGDSWQLVYSSDYIGYDNVSGITSDGHTLVASFAASGVVRSTDGGITWEPFNNGLINLSLSTVRFAGGNLFCAPSGGGIFRTLIPSSVEHGKEGTGTTTASIYPNPCHTSATIRYTATSSNDAPAILGLYNHLGQLVRTIIPEQEGPGRYVAHADVRDLMPGLYFYRAERSGKLEAYPFIVMEQ